MSMHPPQSLINTLRQQASFVRTCQPGSQMIGKQYYGLALVSVFLGMILFVAGAFPPCLTNAAIPGLQLFQKMARPGA